MRTPLDLRHTQDAAAGGDEPVAAYDLITALEANPRYRRDSFLGGIFHLGRICYREISPTDSVHIIIKGEKVSAHVDEVSPLVVGPDGTCRYAWGRVFAHNVLVLLADLARRLRGQHGLQRCNLSCHAEVVEEERTGG